MNATAPIALGFRDPLTAKIAAFLGEIGLQISSGAVPGVTALPGIDIDLGTIVIDEDRLLYPGDVLHEAGHLAVVPPERRAGFHHDVGNDPAEEMMAIAWSWAATRHLSLDPAIVFHPNGYRGGSQAILAAFGAGSSIGTPMLDFVGMSVDPRRAARDGLAPFYPQMRHWLRKA